MRPCRQLVSLQGFFLNTERHAPPSQPNLPFSPRAHYGESDGNVLEQLPRGRLHQETVAQLPDRHIRRQPEKGCAGLRLKTHLTAIKNFLAI